VTAHAEQRLGGFAIADKAYSVTTSAAPDTVRVYDVTGIAFTATDAPMVCTITGAWRAQCPEPSFGGEYIGRDEGWQWRIVAEAVSVIRPRAVSPSPRVVDPPPA